MINIQDIIPFMKKGWVAMDNSGVWVWYSQKPVLKVRRGKFVYTIYNTGDICPLNGFDIAPADDWTKSLIKIDNTAREKFEEEYQNNIQRTIQELNNK